MSGGAHFRGLVLGRNVAVVANRWRQQSDLNGPGIELQTSAPMDLLWVYKYLPRH